jgi:hypothetical protein
MGTKKISENIDDLFMCILGPVDIELLPAMTDYYLVSGDEERVNIF